MSKDTVKCIIDAELLAKVAGGMVHRQGKAKMFNVLESQIPENEIERIGACKCIVDDILSNIAVNVFKLIKDTLGDWQIEVEVGGELSEEEEIKKEVRAQKEYEKIRRILFRKIFQ